MTQKSDLINELAKALCAAQAELHNAVRDSKGNYNDYASLESVRNGITPPLIKHGLSIVQPFGHDGQGDFIETILMHTSGQWISGRLYLKIDKPTMQGLGSAISYARRYSLAAMVNIGQDDDDAQQLEQPRKEAPTSQVNESRAIQQQVERKVLPSSGSTKPDAISPAQEKRFHVIANKKGWSNQEIINLLKEYGCQHASEISWKRYKEICDRLEAPRNNDPIDIEPPPINDEDITL